MSLVVPPGSSVPSKSDIDGAVLVQSSLPVYCGANRSYQGEEIQIPLDFDGTVVHGTGACDQCGDSNSHYQRAKTRDVDRTK